MMQSQTALLVIAMQNDICHPDGVFAKNGLATTHVSPIFPNIQRTMSFCKEKKIPLIALKTTVLVDLEGRAVGLGYLATHRPFLEKEGCREGTWGHDLIDELPSVDFSVRKWGISAFFQTDLSRYLSALGIKELVLTGFTTNGSVETLAREAMSRNYQIITLTDCVASYSDALHHASLTNLASFGQIITTDEWQNNLKNKEIIE